MGLIIWYILPLLVTLLILPKVLAVESSPHWSERFTSPVRMRQLLLALVISLLPVFNLLAVGFSVFSYLYDYKHYWKTSEFLNRPLFPLFKSKKDK